MIQHYRSLSYTLFKEKKKMIEFLPLAVGWYLMQVSALAVFQGLRAATLSARLPKDPP